MNSPQLGALATRLNAAPVVAFAGAGVSIGAPSSLPSWWTLNEWIIEALHCRVRDSFQMDDDYSRVLLDYRNASESFPLATTWATGGRVILTLAQGGNGIAVDMDDSQIIRAQRAKTTSTDGPFGIY